MSFLTHFEALKDKRSHINKKHELLDVVFLTVVALLSGAEGWKDIKLFGDNKLDWLRQFRAFENGIPADTIPSPGSSALWSRRGCYSALCAG